MKELEALFDEMAIKYKDDKKLELDAAKAQLREKMAAAQSKKHGTTVSLHHRCILPRSEKQNQMQISPSVKRMKKNLSVI